MVGPAGWGNPVGGGRPGYGIAGAIPVESSYDSNDPRGLTTLRPMQYLSPASRLVELAASGKHHGVKADPLDLRRLIAWVDACCPFLGEEELRALGDPEFPGHRAIADPAPRGHGAGDRAAVDREFGCTSSGILP